MKKINLSITGCLGRMGKQLIKSSKRSRDFKIVSITENRKINNRVFGLIPKLNTKDAFKNAHVIIDFTVPKSTMEVLKIATKLKKRVVIGTTGFSKKQEKLIKSYSKKIPILKAGNMSLGVNLLVYLTEIASRSRGTPRIANRILKRARDFAEVNNAGTISVEVAKDTLSRLGIDGFGLDEMDRKILDSLVNTFKGGPVGLESLSVAISEDAKTIEEVYEPYLIKEGFIQRTARGRLAQTKAIEYFNKN